MFSQNITSDNYLAPPPIIHVIGFRTCEQAENTRTIDGRKRRHFVYFCALLFFFIKTIVIFFVTVPIRSDYYNWWRMRII